MLKPIYPELELGWMTITAMSSHIYERHFEMVRKIISDPKVAACSVMPVCGHYEAMKLISSAGRVNTDWGNLSHWLLAKEE